MILTSRWYRKCLPLLLSWLVPNGLLAQSPADMRATDSTKALVRAFYNTNQPDKLYALTNDQFQKQVSPDQFRTFIADALTGLGNWKSSDKPVLVSSTWHYKVLFQNATMDFLLQLDNQQKISLFALQPYTLSVTRKTNLLTNNPRRSLLERQIDEAIREYVTDDRVVGLSIGILRNDSLFTVGYGETTKGTNQIPDGNTLFEIGSVTKTFTAALLADAVRRGLVQLDDPVSRYLPDSLPPLRSEGVNVTLKMLANHTSGLPRMAANWSAGNGFSLTDPYALYDEQALFAYLKKPVFAHRPGETYEYSNLATGLLGTILARQEKKSYEQLVADLIARPLRLGDTRITLDATQQKRLAQGYDETGLTASPWTFQALGGAGFMRSTTNDLLHYLQANLGGAPAELAEVLRNTHSQTFVGKNPVETVGLGWHIVNRTGWWWHNGGTGGFRSLIGFNPTHRTAFVLLANSTAKSLDGLDWNLIKTAGL